MASRAEIPASLLAPDSEDCLRAISLAVLKVRSERNFSREKLAKAMRDVDILKGLLTLREKVSRRDGKTLSASQARQEVAHA